MISSRKARVPEALDGQRFDVAAAELFTDLSRKRIKSIIDSGGAYLDKRRVGIAKHGVRAGQTIELFWEASHADPSTPLSTAQKWKVSIEEIRHSLVEDLGGFFVINKPAGIPSQSTLTSSTDTILHALNHADPTRFKLSEMFLVHRLDKDTSGLLVVARTAEWRDRLERCFRERTVEKKYQAICLGWPRESEGEIDFALVRDRSRPNAFLPLKSGRGPKEAKSALTHYRVIEKFPKSQCSLIECKPFTGRTHQIRVHLMAIGCPILGDRTYAAAWVGHPFGHRALRHMLHAASLTLTLEDLGARVWNAAPPADFLRCLDELRQSEAR